MALFHHKAGVSVDTQRYIWRGKRVLNTVKFLRLWGMV